VLAQPAIMAGFFMTEIYGSPERRQAQAIPKKKETKMPQLNLSFRDALPLLLERHYNGRAKAPSEALAALQRMADMADELADLQERQLMNCGAPHDTVTGMAVSVGG
jgi:hypothetical protein